MNVHVCTLQTGALLKLSRMCQAEFSGKYGSWTGPGHDLEAGSKAPSPKQTHENHVTLVALFGWPMGRSSPQSTGWRLHMTQAFYDQCAHKKIGKKSWEFFFAVYIYSILYYSIPTYKYILLQTITAHRDTYMSIYTATYAYLITAYNKYLIPGV